MCGRYTLRRHGLLKKLLYQEEFEEFSETRIVFRPATNIPIVRFNQAKQRVLSEVNWGLIPFWSKTGDMSPPNAVSETITSKPMFREPFKRRRCLIPADGFFEPKGDKKQRIRQPYFFQRHDRELIAFAGLWDRWTNPEGQTIESCVLMTIGPNNFMKPIHDRMPVILDPADYDRWLNRDIPGESVKDLLRPAPEDLLECWQTKDQEKDPDTNEGIREGAKDP